jgi:hypothetical protein
MKGDIASGTSGAGNAQRKPGFLFRRGNVNVPAMRTRNFGSDVEAQTEPWFDRPFPRKNGKKLS